MKNKKTLKVCGMVLAAALICVGGTAAFARDSFVHIFTGENGQKIELYTSEDINAASDDDTSIPDPTTETYGSESDSNSPEIGDIIENTDGEPERVIATDGDGAYITEPAD